MSENVRCNTTPPNISLPSPGPATDKHQSNSHVDDVVKVGAKIRYDLLSEGSERRHMGWHALGCYSLFLSPAEGSALVPLAPLVPLVPVVPLHLHVFIEQMLLSKATSKRELYKVHRSLIITTI